MRSSVRLHIKAKKYAVHLSDESTRCPFPMNCLCSTCRLTDSGRFVGNPEVICPGSGLVMGSRLVFTTPSLTRGAFLVTYLVKLPPSRLLGSQRDSFVARCGRTM